MSEQGPAPAPEPIAATAWLLQAARLVRSIWQGALVVDFALYLKALGWDAIEISAVLSAALVFGAALTILLGPLSDRFGRRRFLLVYDTAQGVAALVAWWTPATLPLVLAAVMGGFGRGGNGAAGPFSPVEQAWMAQCVPASRRGMFYSVNAALGFFGMAAGAVLAGAPGWVWGAAPPAAAYRPLFLLTALLSFVTLVMIWLARDAEAGRGRVEEDSPLDRARENGLVRRLVLANLLNGTGIGLSGPLITYWFALKFNHGPASIGAMMAVGFVLAGIASLLAGRLANRVGVVRAVVLMRLAGLALLVALPFAGSFLLASAFYIARTVLNRGTSGARSAVNVGIVRATRRGYSSAVSNVALQVPRAIGPVFAGVLFEAGFLAAPFLAAAVFQAGYVWVYDRSFRHIELK